MRRVSAAVVVLVCGGLLVIRPAAMEKGTVKFFNNDKFSVQIPGAPDFSKNIREVSIDELNIDAREMTSGLDVEYRLYGPGHAHWGNATFKSACVQHRRQEDPDGLSIWWREAAKGKNIRKNITINLRDSDGKTGRTYTLVDVIPVSLSTCDMTAAEPVETLVVQPSSIEFGSRNESVALDKPLSGIRVLLHLPNGRVNPDDTWELVAGGAKSHEEPPLLLGRIDPADPTIDMRAHQTCTNLTLRGPMTDARGWLADWVNDATQAQRFRNYTVTIPIGGLGNVPQLYVYNDAFPVGYVFPHLDVTDSAQVQEEVRIKPVRCELQ